MIPMSCPNCGSQGEVPLDRLNSRLKCRKCGTYFYMDQTGHIVLGDPNAKGKKGKRPKVVQPAGPALDLDIASMVRNIPKPVKLGAIALAIVAAVGYGVTTLLASMGLPEDIEGRSNYVGELFVDNKLDELRAIAAPGTADDLAKWHELVRPRFNYEGARKSPDDVLSYAGVVQGGDSAAESFVNLTVAGAPIVPSGTAKEIAEGPQNILTLPLFWSRSDGEWLVDGTRTLQKASQTSP